MPPMTPAPTPAAAAFEDQLAAVLELSGPEHVVCAASRAARELFGAPDPVGRPLAEAVPTLESPALAQLAEIRGTGGAVCGVVWPLLVDGRRVVVEADLAGVRRDAGPGVLVHARPVVGGPATLRDTTLALQRALLPDALPVLPDVDLAAHYAPGALRSGGDWFDVLVTDDGRIALHTGDVVGHGPAAAASMGALATALRVALAEGAAPAAALAHLDRFAARQPGTRGAAAAVVLLDPATGALAHARCGHPPPVIGGVDGLRTLHGAGGGPLGMGAAAATDHRAVLAPGETLLLHTDGVQPTGGPQRNGGPRPGRWATAGPTAAQWCAALLDRPGRAPPTGDVAVIAAHRRATPLRPLQVEAAAEPAELGPLRERLSDWLGALDVSAETAAALPLVLSELVSNSVEHAYPAGQAGAVRVEVGLDGSGGIRVVVDDGGCWRPPEDEPATRGGFGLVVVHELCDAVDIATGPHGTRITATCPARRPTAVGGPAVSRPRAVPDAPLTLTDRAGVTPVVAADGVIDIATVEELRTAVLRRSAAGSRAIVIDLTAVTMLGSVGVRLLHEAARFAAPPRVIAPQHTPARQVLEMTRLDHLLDVPG
jgi:anti-anti-sigma factor